MKLVSKKMVILGVLAPSQNLCTDSVSNQETLLRVSDWLIEHGEHQDAETVLYKVLNMDPSVTSSDHVRAMCTLASSSARPTPAPHLPRQRPARWSPRPRPSREPHSSAAIKLRRLALRRIGFINFMHINLTRLGCPSK
jgi:hypothetical protein